MRSGATPFSTHRSTAFSTSCSASWESALDPAKPEGPGPPAQCCTPGIMNSRAKPSVFPAPIRARTLS